MLSATKHPIIKATYLICGILPSGQNDIRRLILHFLFPHPFSHSRREWEKKEVIVILLPVLFMLLPPVSLPFYLWEKVPKGRMRAPLTYFPKRTADVSTSFPVKLIFVVKPYLQCTVSKVLPSLVSSN